jgi:hypothetical protein
MAALIAPLEAYAIRDTRYAIRDTRYAIRITYCVRRTSRGDEEHGAAPDAGADGAAAATVLE